MHAFSPESFEEHRTIEVQLQGVPVNNLNELEITPDGKYLLANEWRSDNIHLIDIETGTLKHTFDFSQLDKINQKAANNIYS